GRRRWRDGSRSQVLSEEVVRSQVLEGLEACACGADVHITIERAYGSAQREVTGRPGARAAEVAREEPVRRPLAEPAQRGKPRLDLLVGLEGQSDEIEVGAREPDHVLRLAPREAERGQLLLRGGREPLPRRERPDPAHPLAEPLDEPVADRDGCKERDLLRRDRSDEHLERVRRERRPETGEADDERYQQ